MKHPDTASLKYVFIGYVVAAMTFLLVIIILSATFYQQKRFSEEKRQYREQLHTSMERVLESLTHDLERRLYRMIDRADFVAMMQNRDREGIYMLVEPEWKRLQQELPAVNILHFHLPDGTSLLRMHKPGVYGDLIAPYRPMLQEIHRTHKRFVGYETGKHGIAYRSIFPLFDASQRYIGAVEIGMNPKFLVRKISEMTGYSGLFFIHQEALKLFSEPLLLRVGPYALLQSVKMPSSGLLASVGKLKRLEEGIIVEAGGDRYVSYLFTLRDFQGNARIKLLFLEPLQARPFERWLLGALIIGIVLSLGLLAYLIYRRLHIYEVGVSAMYEAQAEDLRRNKEYLSTILEVSPNILLTTDGTLIERANRMMLDFVGYASIEDFRKDYDCICDLFIEKPGYLQKEMNGVLWLDYIYAHPDKVHKACLENEGVEHDFIVYAHMLGCEASDCSVVLLSDVTELERSRQRLAFAIEGANDGLFDWDFVTGELYLSPRWKAIIGYRDDELPNRFEAWEKRIDPEEVKRVLEAFEAYRSGRLERFEQIYRMRHKNGTWVFVLARGSIHAQAPNRLVGTHTDISTLKALELQLRRSQRTFELFLQQVPGYIIIKDEAGHIVFANRSACAFFGRDSLEGLQASELLGEEKALFAEAIDHRVANEGPADLVAEFDDLQGRSRIFRLIGFMLPDERGRDYTALLLFDITQSYYDQKKLKEKDELLMAQSRHAAMGEMIGMIAHQWRQPISIIAHGANNMLADIDFEELDTQQVVRHAKGILKQTRYLSKTIDDFRNFFRPNKEMESVHIADIVDEVVFMMGKSLEYNQIRLTITDRSRRQVNVYSGELMQVFINLIKNAKEALVDNRSSDRRIEILIEEDAHAMTTRVCDNGGGIDPEILHRVFDPYFTTKSEQVGTGIGLYMSKSIIEKHMGGRLSVRNAEEGACFTLTIPFDGVASVEIERGESDGNA